MVLLLWLDLQTLFYNHIFGSSEGTGKELRFGLGSGSRKKILVQTGSSMVFVAQRYVILLQELLPYLMIIDNHSLINDILPHIWHEYYEKNMAATLMRVSWG